MKGVNEFLKPEGQYEDVRIYGTPGATERRWVRKSEQAPEESPRPKARGETKPKVAATKKSPWDAFSEVTVTPTSLDAPDNANLPILGPTESADSRLPGALPSGLQPHPLIEDVPVYDDMEEEGWDWRPPLFHHFMKR